MRVHTKISLIHDAKIIINFLINKSNICSASQTI